MIRLVRKYHDKSEYDVAYESGRIVMYNEKTIPKTAVRFMEDAGDVRHKDDEFCGMITEYRKGEKGMDKIVNMKHVYWVIVKNSYFGDPDHFVMVAETEDLDEAVRIAKDQYSDAPQCKGNHAFVVLRDRWNEGDETPYIDVQPD